MGSSDTYQRQFDEDVQQNEHNSCPECGGRVTTNISETVCDDCGLVIEDEQIDHGPEWREFDDDQTTARRTGSPNTVARHDRGIGTQIGWKRDSAGRDLGQNKRQHLARLRREHRRAKTNSTAERNQIAGFTDIRRMVAALGLTDAVRDQACQLFRSAQGADLLRGRSIESIASACIYAVCRLNEHPRPFEKIGRVSRVNTQRIKQAYKVLNRELNLPVPPAGPQQYLPQIASAVDVRQETERQARDLLEAVDEWAVANGQNPMGAAGGALYLAAQQTGEPLTQADIADVAGVSKPTIRERYRDLEAATSS